MTTNWIYDLGQWLGSLDAPFAFLLALPFLVASVGLISLLFKKRRAGHS